MNKIEEIERERLGCIRRRDEKVELRDAIGAAGWDGRVQGLEYALAVLNERDKTGLTISCSEIAPCPLYNAEA